MPTYEERLAGMKIEQEKRTEATSKEIEFSSLNLGVFGAQAQLSAEGALTLSVYMPKYENARESEWRDVKLSPAQVRCLAERLRELFPEPSKE